MMSSRSQETKSSTPPRSSNRSAITSAWSPLGQPLFRALWIADLVSNIGTWMQNVGGVWLMTSLARSPIMVALMQTATSLPVFLIGLPAGALADIVDRRRMLLFAHGWMLAAAVGLGVLTLIGAITPWGLLTFTFALGLGAAMNSPAWQAITRDLVSRAELPAAVTLSGVAFNIARAVGPALGGVVVAAIGPGAVFLLNAASFVGVMVVLYRWHRLPRKSGLPAERMIGALRAGMRYVRYAPAVNAVLVRAAAFILCSSALWALLPLVARSELGLGSMGYGALLGSLGMGAVTGALILPKVRPRLSANGLVAGAIVLFAAVTVALAYAHNLGLLCAALLAGGVAWIAVMSSLNVAAQTVAPAWVGARALAVYLLVLQGGMAGGSVLWGAVAARAGIQVALLCAALGLVIGLAAIKRYPLMAGEALDLAPIPWAGPIVMMAPHPEEGPILVSIEYRIDPERSRDFTQAMWAVCRIRRRDGAIRWGLFRDAADPSRYVETFIVDSWAEHLRQHERMTVADRAVKERAQAFHIGSVPPTVSHLIYAYGSDVKK